MKEIAQPVVSEAAKYGMAILVLVVVLMAAGFAIVTLWKNHLKMQAQLMEVVKENSLALQDTAQSNRETSNAFAQLEKTIQILISKL